MTEDFNNKTEELEKEKIRLEIRNLKPSKVKLIIIQSVTTIITTFLILLITWFLNRNYISLSLDVKRLKSEKESLEIELRKDSLSKLAKEYLDSAMFLKRQVEIRDLRSRVAIVDDVGLMEIMLFFDFNKAIEKYNESKNQDYLFSLYVTNIKLIENIRLRYSRFSAGEQIKDTLNVLWNNNFALWKKIEVALKPFGKINSKTPLDSIDKYIKKYEELHNYHSNMMRNIFVNDKTGELEILEIPGMEKKAHNSGS